MIILGKKRKKERKKKKNGHMSISEHSNDPFIIWDCSIVPLSKFAVVFRLGNFGGLTRKEQKQQT